MNHLIESRVCLEAGLLVSASIVDRCVMVWQIKTHPDPELVGHRGAAGRDSRDLDEAHSREERDN